MITYSDFTTYPTKILGIDETSDTDLQAMELVAIDMLDYSGAVADITEVIKLLVFVLFCSGNKSFVSVDNGENRDVDSVREPMTAQKNTAMFLAEKKLKAICSANGTTADFNSFAFFYDHL
jgi:hypothetical protein